MNKEAQVVLDLATAQIEDAANFGSGWLGSAVVKMKEDSARFAEGMKAAKGKNHNVKILDEYLLSKYLNK